MGFAPHSAVHCPLNQIIGDGAEFAICPCNAVPIENHYTMHVLSSISSLSPGVGLLVLLLGASWSLSGCGGCDAKQKNFRTSPETRCITYIADVCDAQSNWITLKNSCDEPLQIGPLSPQDGAGGSGSAAVTILPGATETILHPILDSYSGGVSHLRIRARLGDTAVVITFDVVG